MLRKLLALIAIFGVTTCAMAQSGTLSGTVTEEGTGEPAPFANIVIESGGTVVAGGVTDFDGLYSIKPIAPGSYTVKISFIGFATRQINEVVISPDKITVQNAALKKASDVLAEVEIVEYVVPLIDPDKTGTTKTKDEIVALPTRNIGTVAATAAGVTQVDEGDEYDDEYDNPNKDANRPHAENETAGDHASLTQTNNGSGDNAKKSVK